jgi:hypothetical protein
MPKQSKLDKHVQQHGAGQAAILSLTAKPNANTPLPIPTTHTVYSPLANQADSDTAPAPATPCVPTPTPSSATPPAAAQPAAPPATPAATPNPVSEHPRPASTAALAPSPTSGSTSGSTTSFTGGYTGTSASSSTSSSASGSAPNSPEFSPYPTEFDNEAMVETDDEQHSIGTDTDMAGDDGFQRVRGRNNRRSRNRDKEEKDSSDDSSRDRRSRKRQSLQATHTPTLASEAPLQATAFYNPALPAVPAQLPVSRTALPAGAVAEQPTTSPAAAPAAVQPQLQPQPARTDRSAASQQPRQAPADVAAQQPQQQQQKGRQRTNVAPAPRRLIERCGAKAESDTSLVLTLAANAAQLHAAVAAWGRLPHPSNKNGRSVAAVATLLDKLHIPLPHLPRLYNECSTAAELADKLDRRDRTTTDSGISWAEQLTPAQLGSPLGAVLVNMANVVANEMGDTEKTKLTHWLDVLTPMTGCMSRRSAALTSQPQAREMDGQSRARCVLRLDFASPLVRRSVEYYLNTLHVSPMPAATQRPTSSSKGTPLVSLTLDHYRHRLISARVSGFAVGPTCYDATRRFTNLYEPHGNWQLLRSWLATQAPHCSPADTALRFSSGVAAVDFVLEETHLYELYALHQAVAPEAGITQPLNLTVSVRRQSPNVACSICGGAKHKARDCPSKPADRAQTCRACYATGHTAEQCHTQPSERTCTLCNVAGHSTLQCRKYKPRWVDVANLGTDRQPRQRNTFATERVAVLQGKAPALQAAQSATQRAARPPPRSEAEYPSISSNAATNHHTAHTAPAWQQPAKLSALEEAVIQLAKQMADMQQQAEARMEELRQDMRRQNEWMQQIMLRVLDSSPMGGPKSYRLAPENHNCSAQPQHSPPPAATATTPTPAIPQQQSSATQALQPHATTSNAIHGGPIQTHTAPPLAAAQGGQHFHAHNHAGGSTVQCITASGFQYVHAAGSGVTSSLSEQANPRHQHTTSTAIAHGTPAHQQQPPAYGAQPAPTTSISNDQ